VIPLALSRADVADYVSALFTVYIILILLNVLISYVPRMPYRPWLRSLLDFITDSTNPYLNFLRRFLPSIGGSSFALDLSPIIGIILLFVLQIVVAGLIAG
jgi:YggT family protein